MSDYLEGIPTVDLNLFLNGTDSEKMSSLINWEKHMKTLAS